MRLAAASACSSVEKVATGATGPKISSREHARVGGHVGEHGRLVEVAGAVERARRRASTLRAALDARRRPARATFVALALRRSAGRRRRRARCRGRPSARPSARPAAGELLGHATRARGSGWPPCRPRRRCASSPSIAPSTAASRSASSNTRNGALPPSSIETRRTCSADCSISVRPTSVEPVNESLRVRGSCSSGSITAPERLAVITFSTPPGQAGLLEDLRQREHRQRRLLGGLDDHRAAGGDRRGDLARAHRRGEVPRRHEHARPDRLAHRQDPALAGRVDHVAAVDAHGLLGEPAEELGRVGDLRARLARAPCPSRASSAAPARRRCATIAS